MKGDYMKKFLSILLCVLVVLSVAACGKKDETPSGQGDGNEKYSGTVMLYTSAGEDAAQSLKEVFEKKYPNVTLDFYAATSGKCNTKLATEFEAGNVSCDVVWLAEPSGLIDFKNQDRLLQYKSPFADAVAAPFKDPDGYYCGARILIMGLAYSETTCPKDQVPLNFDGLLDPNFTGQIIMADPNASGSSKAFVYGLVHSEKYGWEYFEKLAEQKLEFDTSANAVNQKIAGGEYKIGVSPEHTTLNSISQGSPIGYQATQDVLAIACPIAIPKGCPNEELAKLLYDFILDPQGGQAALPTFNITPIVDGITLPAGMKSAKEITANALPIDWVDLANTGTEMLEKFNKLFGK
ncbi:MAG: extracellular solute-binding protein [Erysipelotrichaceae bacterium]|nr:extracellular solute-binding protein [Erysipelotrichaceae bacterium]